jgi:hypothetical protein
VNPGDSVRIGNFEDGSGISAYGGLHGSGKWSASAEGGMPMFPVTGMLDSFIGSDGAPPG